MRVGKDRKLEANLKDGLKIERNDMLCCQTQNGGKKWQNNTRFRKTNDYLPGLVLHDALHFPVGKNIGFLCNRTSDNVAIAAFAARPCSEKCPRAIVCGLQSKIALGIHLRKREADFFVKVSLQISLRRADNSRTLI